MQALKSSLSVRWASRAGQVISFFFFNLAFRLDSEGVPLLILTCYVLSWLNYRTTWCYSGVKNADEAELRQVASEPVDLNVYNVNDFPLLSKLVARLVHILCGRIEERGITKRMPPIFVAICVFLPKTELFLMASDVSWRFNALCFCVSRNGAWFHSRSGPLLPQSY